MGYAAGDVCGDRSTPKLRYAAEVGGRNGIGKNGKLYGKATAVGTRNHSIYNETEITHYKLYESFHDLPQILTADKTAVRRGTQLE